MPRSYDSIENEITDARDQLAQTLDAIADRVNPKNLADTGKVQAMALLKDPRVLAAAGAVTAIVVTGVLGLTASKRRRERRIDAYLATRSARTA